MNISVFGLGYVGSVTAACLAEAGHNVIGIDIKEEKVNKINAGQSPVFEPGLNDIVEQQVKMNRLSGTPDAVKAINESELSLVCVGTPNKPNGDVDLEHLERVCKQIGEIIRNKKKRHSVVIRSTIPPGTTEKRLIPILEEQSKKNAFEDFGIGLNPEFLREGSAIEDFKNPEKNVIGANDILTKQSIEKIFEQMINSDIFILDIRTAEMIKYSENAFHAMKVVFANEIGSICKKLKIDGGEVLKILCEDKKLNLSPYYLRPGFAYGGSCLPKDLQALSYMSKELNLEIPLLNSIPLSNERHIDRVVELIIVQNKKKIGIIGLSFKSDTDDIRRSPILRVIEKIVEHGQLKLFDKKYTILIHDSKLDRNGIVEIFPYLQSMLIDDIDEMIDKSEVIVITNKYRHIDKKAFRNKIVLDLQDSYRDFEEEPSITYINLCK